MNSQIITVEGLTKVYRVPERESGLRAALRALVRPVYTQVHAVTGLNFTIEAGEMVGLIGQNGAGKTTTLKMLAGLLYPSAGSARVAGFTPWERKNDFLRQISMVLGNKSQMIWDIPALDTLRVLAEIYNIPAAELSRRVEELSDLLDLDELLTRPVRNLSLGERMKCELAAGLLHRPAVLFLDEPTLGLDVSIQARVRRFVAEYNQRFGATVILTSHYMADVQALCPRVILIHNGTILYDGALSELARRLAPYKLLKVTLNAELENGIPELPPGAEFLGQEDHTLTLRVGRDDAPGITAALLNRMPVADLVVEDPPIEAVIDKIYQEGAL